MLNDLSYGIKIWTDVSSVLSQFMRLTDRRTDGQNSHRYTASALHAVKNQTSPTEAACKTPDVCGEHDSQLNDSDPEDNGRSAENLPADEFCCKVRFRDTRLRLKRDKNECHIPHRHIRTAVARSDATRRSEWWEADSLVSATVDGLNDPSAAST